MVFEGRDPERRASRVVGLTLHLKSVLALPGGQFTVQFLCNSPNTNKHLCRIKRVRLLNAAGIHTCFGMYLVIPLLHNQERVSVAMTSLELDLQASESVRNGVVKYSHLGLHTVTCRCSYAVLSSISTHSVQNLEN